MSFYYLQSKDLKDLGPDRASFFPQSHCAHSDIAIDAKVLTSFASSASVFEFKAPVGSGVNKKISQYF